MLNHKLIIMHYLRKQFTEKIQIGYRSAVMPSTVTNKWKCIWCSRELFGDNHLKDTQRQQHCYTYTHPA